MASEQCCLKWSNHGASLLSTFEYLRSSEALVDVTLACDGLSVKAHKMVLAACSPFFQSLFLENPCQHPIVMMTDVSYKDLRVILDFMYCGEVSIPQDQLPAILKIAGTLKVKGLANMSRKNCQTPGQNSSVRLSSLDSALDSEQQRPPSATDSVSRSHRRKKRRSRKRLLSNSSCSDDDIVPFKQKQVDFSEIELSGDSMEEIDCDKSLDQNSNNSERSSVKITSSKRNHSPLDSKGKKLPFRSEKEIKIEPCEQTAVENNNVLPVTSCSSSNLVSLTQANASTSNEAEVMETDDNAKNPSLSACRLSSSMNLLTAASATDVKPAILTFEDPSVSLVVETLESLSYDDQLSVPGSSDQVTCSFVPQDGQQEAVTDLMSHEHALKHQLDVIHYTQKTILEKLKFMENVDGKVEGIASKLKLPNFPLKKVKELDDLECKLCDSLFKKCVMKELSKIGGKDVPAIAVSLMNHVLTPELGVYFTFYGTKEKRPFVNLQLCFVITEVVRMHVKNATNEVISKPIQTWLRHCKEKVERNKAKAASSVTTE